MDFCLIRGRIQANLVSKQSVVFNLHFCIKEFICVLAKMQSIRTGQNIQGSGLFLFAVCDGGNFKHLLKKIVTSCSIEWVTGYFGPGQFGPRHQS